MSVTRSEAAGAGDSKSVRVAALIPAHNEAATVGDVVRIVRQSSLIHEVIVIDNASSDRTSEVAARAGARIVHEPTPGKGEAMRAGCVATDAEILVFFDADLLNLTLDHVDSLVRPMLAGQAEMVCGLFDRGPLINPLYLRALPILTGQRAIRRDLFCSLAESATTGFRIEAAMNSLIAVRGLRRIDFICPNLWQRSKEKKRGFVTGLIARLKMYGSVVFSYALCAATPQWNGNGADIRSSPAR
jgi:glycosyltransferase involved in cell wall biosynthesis